MAHVNRDFLKQKHKKNQPTLKFKVAQHTLNQAVSDSGLHLLTLAAKQRKEWNQEEKTSYKEEKTSCKNLFYSTKQQYTQIARDHTHCQHP